MATLGKRTLFLVSTAFACFGVCAAAAWAQAAAAPKLQAYTTPDKTASAGLPSGWKVTTGAQTVIVMTGPQNETISLGNTLVVRDGAFQLNQAASGGVDLSIPNSDTISQKFTMAMQHGAALAGYPDPQVKITSETPLQIPATVGQCGHILAGMNGKTGPVTVAALMCSLPIDAGHTYKMIFITAQAPPAVAQQEGALASAVFASYRIPSNMLQMKVAPFYVPPAVANAETAAILKATAIQQNAVNTQANCFDLTVLRQTPTRLLPRACGGPGPN
jgi:hypothetical protein